MDNLTKIGFGLSIVFGALVGWDTCLVKIIQSHDRTTIGVSDVLTGSSATAFLQSHMCRTWFQEGSCPAQLLSILLFAVSIISLQRHSPECVINY
jgi:hypothetical protein